MTTQSNISTSSQQPEEDADFAIQKLGPISEASLSISNTGQTSAEVKTTRSKFRGLASGLFAVCTGVILLYAPTYLGWELSPDAQHPQVAFILLLGGANLLVSAVWMEWALSDLIKKGQMSYLGAGLLLSGSALLLALIANTFEIIREDMAKSIALLFLMLSLYNIFQALFHLYEQRQNQLALKASSGAESQKKALHLKQTSGLIALLAGLFTLLAALAQIIAILLPAITK